MLGVVWRELHHAMQGHPSPVYVAVVLTACIAWLSVYLTVALVRAGWRMRQR